MEILKNNVGKKKIFKGTVEGIFVDEDIYVQFKGFYGIKFYII